MIICCKAYEYKLTELLTPQQLYFFNMEVYRMLQITSIMACEDPDFKKFLNSIIKPTDEELKTWGMRYGKIFTEWKEKNNAKEEK